MDVITTHLNADFDCLGSMVAARRLYPGAAMVFSGAQERGVRDFFLRGGANPADFPRLRDLDLDAVTRLILVDVRQSDRIGPFGRIARRPGIEIHIYDHHPAGQADLAGTLEYIEPVGSTVTVLAEIFRERGIVPTPEEATLMMLGLYEDTGSLLFSSTTERDYHAAAFLLAHGASLNTVADFLIQELSAEQVELLHQLILSRTVVTVEGIEISVAHASVDQFVGDLAVLAHKLKDMENLDALVVAVRMGDRIFMVGRSRVPEVPMGGILGEFGGGGHGFAAAATVRDLTLVQILDRLPQVLKNHVNPRWEARHLMSSPVKTVELNTSIAEVRQVLTRYSINAMPVMEEGRVAGIITRQVADRAAHHGLLEMPAGEFMTRDFSAVAPSTPAEILQEMVVEHNQRFVPVLEDGRLVGAVTRTDLLRHMVAGTRSIRAADIAPEAAAAGLTLKKRQVARLLHDQLPPRITVLLREMGQVADDLEMSAFAVGGFVRDLLLRLENLDIDIVVEGDGIAFAAEFARRHGCRVRTHRKFGTAVIIFPDGFKVDIASTRMEYYVAPGALPTVEHATIKLDLFRRDFTINTLALSLNGPRYGELLDFFGAQRDLKEKAIRILHNLSFVEDPTRVFRAIRFEQRLGFHLGKHTEYLLRSAARLGFLEKVGGRRTLNELMIVLKEPDPLPAVLRMAELDLLKFIHPALTVRGATRPLFEAASRTLHWYELLYTGEPLEKWVVYFLCLTADLDPDAIGGVGERLDIPPRFRHIFGPEREEGMRVLQFLERRRPYSREPKPSEIYHLVDPLPTEVVLFLMAKAGGEKVRRWISHYFTHLRGTVPLLSGKDLREVGIPPGPIYKKILQHLLDARLNGRVVTREDEIARVRRFLKKAGIRNQET